MAQQIEISILADAKKFQAAIGQATGSNGLGKLQSIAGSAGRKVGSALKGIALGAAGVAAGVGAIALKGGIDRMLSIENAQAKMEGLGHSTETVETVMTNALAAVKGTAFGLGDAATVAATALASGVDAGAELETYLKLVADAATIAGVPLNEMGQIMNKVTTEGNVTNEVLDQFGERGVGALSMLADEYGVTAGEMKKMVSAGEIDAATFNRVLTENLGGAAQKSGETTVGAFANMKASLSRFGEALLGGPFGSAKDVFNNITGAVDTLTGKLKTFLEENGPAIQAFGEGVKTWFQDTALPAIERLWAFITEKFIPALQDFYNEVKGPVTEAWEAFASIFTDNEEGFSNTASIIGDVLILALEGLGEIIKQVAPVVESIFNYIAENQWVIVALGVAFGAAAIAIGLAVAPVATVIAILAVLVIAIGAVIKYWDEIKFATKVIWEAVKGYVAAAVDGIKSAVATRIANVVSDISSKWQSIKATASGAWEGIKSAITGKIDSARTAVSTKVEGIKSALGNAWSSIKSALGTAWSGIVSAVKTHVGNLVSAVKGIRSRVTGALSGAGSWLVSAGRDVIRGMINGIGQMASQVASKARNVVPGAVNAARSALGIASPSKVFKQIGKYSVEGLLLGLNDKGRVALKGEQLAKGLVGGYSLRASRMSNESTRGNKSITIKQEFNVPTNADMLRFGQLVDEGLNQWKRYAG